MYTPCNLCATVFPLVATPFCDDIAIPLEMIDYGDVQDVIKLLIVVSALGN